MQSFNELKMSHQGGKKPWVCQTDNSTEGCVIEPDGIRLINTRAVFRNHAGEIIRLIQEHDWVIGCVAWFTDISVLETIKNNNKKCLIVLNKEDWLRSGSGDNMRKVVNLYQTIAETSFLLDYYGNGQEDPGDVYGAFRLMGVIGGKQRPLMHNKFLLFVDSGEYSHHNVQTLWTGSFNITKNGSRSFENALILDRKGDGHHEIIEAYYDEFHQILKFSERIDYASTHVNPEYVETDWEIPF